MIKKNIYSRIRQWLWNRWRINRQYCLSTSGRRVRRCLIVRRFCRRFERVYVFESVSRWTCGVFFSLLLLLLPHSHTFHYKCIKYVTYIFQCMCRSSEERIVHNTRNRMSLFAACSPALNPNIYIIHNTYIRVWRKKLLLCGARRCSLWIFDPNWNEHQTARQTNTTHRKNAIETPTCIRSSTFIWDGHWGG